MISKDAILRAVTVALARMSEKEKSNLSFLFKNRKSS